MPVYAEYATPCRDLRVLPSFAPALPRLSPKLQQTTEKEEQVKRYEVVISGAGPAGLMMGLLLSRYGLTDESLLCLDSKSGLLKAGQADGLQPRTLEVLKTLGLADEILTDGCQLWEVAFWNPAEVDSIIERTSIVLDITVPARFPHEVTIHQGRIERILEDDMRRYSKRGVQRSSRLLDVHLDENGDPEFPVIAHIEITTEEGETVQQTIRTKYLVGADGAHSAVRRAVGIDLEGDSSDHIWGVVDFVADTNFPDIRRRSAIHSSVGSVMIIPRERTVTGEYLTRLYVQVPGDVNPDNDTENGDNGDARSRRSRVSVDGIFKQAQAVLRPYYIRQKDGTELDWWAAYQIGQRVAKKFSSHDSKGVARIFIVGDACHTHSPKAGQGMNVSMMDSYNLAWKLAYAVHGLTPDLSSNVPFDLLDTYHIERHTIAQQLIEFDRTFSSMFSGKINRGNKDRGDDCKETSVGELSHEQFLEAFSTGNGFTSGCGIEYPESTIVDKKDSHFANHLLHQKDYLSGILRPGRRLNNVRLRRYADGRPRDIHDDLLSTGRFRIIVLTSTDLLSPSALSASAIKAITTDIIPSFPSSILEMIVLHPGLGRSFEWKEIPEAIRQHAEMSFYNGTEPEDAYDTYGVPVESGLVAVVRPDGYIGMVAPLNEIASVDRYLGGCIRKISN